MKLSICFFCSVVLLCGCSYLNRKAGLEDDNIIEEVAEEIFERKTGVDIDFTPSSEEKSFWITKTINGGPHSIVCF